MPVILKVERKSAKARVFLALIYSVLIIGGITMVWPFLVMVSASFTGAYDYHRYSPVVRAFWDRSDRFMRHISSCFERFPVAVYPEAPREWGSWIVVSRDEQGCKEFAAKELAGVDDPATLSRWEIAAADYSRFNYDYDPLNSVCNYDSRHIASFVRHHFENQLKQENPDAYSEMTHAERRTAALALLNREWSIRYRSFFGIRMVAEKRAPLHHAGWDYPTDNPKFMVFQDFKQAYRGLEFETGCKSWKQFAVEHGIEDLHCRVGSQSQIDTGVGSQSQETVLKAENGYESVKNAFKEYAAQHSPMTPVIPYASRNLWLKHLKRPDSQVKLGFADQNLFSPENYSTVAGHSCSAFAHLPFPLPEGSSGIMQSLWDDFIHTAYPRRLLRIRATPELEKDYQEYIRELCKSIDAYNELTGESAASFKSIKLRSYENSTLWRNFIPSVPLENLEVLSAEKAWQDFILDKYGSLNEINKMYGWNMKIIEEARFPIREAIAVTFKKRGARKFLAGALANYRMVGEYLFLRGRAFGNTFLLVVLSILATLTVNPLAAYALSRFGLKSTEKILLFLLATMAFPAAVTAIPGFLLIRDLGLLNSFAALVLPTVASGMSIFILKGFFDGLPRELYEAATVDGAKEWQIFLRITLPMTTPILAVNALHSFVAAYNSWEWALLVCQKQSYWTLAVWMYQMSQQFGGQPWAVMAGFVLVSVPTAIVFIACQKVILRGIVLPSMK